MIALRRPPEGRTRLAWHELEQIQTNEWVLKLRPPYYGAVFADRKPDLAAKSPAGFHIARTGAVAWAVFRGLTPRDLARINDFAGAYRRFVLLGDNPNLKGQFSDELDGCLALDYNFAESRSRSYTEIGELVYHAKYRRSVAAAEELGRRLAEAAGRVPTMRCVSRPCLSYVPPGPHKRFDLPRILARLLVDYGWCTMPLREFEPLVHPELSLAKPDFKRLTIDEKIRAWTRLLARGVRLSGNVAGAAVYVIDDLYQSGATLWSYARYLKAAGAAAVFGLVCEKSRGDRDNR